MDGTEILAILKHLSLPEKSTATGIQASYVDTLSNQAWSHHTSFAGADLGMDLETIFL